MQKQGFRRHLAAFIRKAPWIIRFGRVFWRFRQAKFTVGVVGVLMNPQGEVLLVEHVFHPYHPWGLPGGWVDRNEDPAQGLARELKEELQLTVTVGPLLNLKLESGNHLDFAYLCEHNEAIGPLSSEILAYKWTAPQDLPRMYDFHYQAVQHALNISSRTEV
jgi:8-oxo-dGTP pyrophosphatase MutT (NUDIX family)